MEDWVWERGINIKKDCSGQRQGELVKATVEHTRLHIRCHICDDGIKLDECIFVHGKPASVRRYFDDYPVCHIECRNGTRAKTQSRMTRLQQIKERKRLETFRPIMDDPGIDGWFGTSDSDN